MIRYTQPEIDAIVAERVRRRAKKGHSTAWGLAAVKNDFERMGVAGEVAFSEAFQVPIDRQNKRWGDGGVDFRIPAGTVDVKTARWGTTRLKVKANRPMPDIFVMAIYDALTGQARLVGWTTREELAALPQVKSQYGHMNYEMPIEALKPIEELRQKEGER